MINPRPQDLGRRVVYTAYRKKEYGILTSWNSRYAFVRYDGTTQRVATNFTDLEWVPEERVPEPESPDYPDDERPY